MKIELIFYDKSRWFIYMFYLQTRGPPVRVSTDYRRYLSYILQLVFMSLRRKSCLSSRIVCRAVKTSPMRRTAYAGSVIFECGGDLVAAGLNDFLMR